MGDHSQMVPKVPSNPNHSVIPWCFPAGAPYLPYRAQSLGWIPEHSRIRMGKLGFAFFRVT